MQHGQVCPHILAGLDQGKAALAERPGMLQTWIDPLYELTNIGFENLAEDLLQLVYSRLTSESLRMDPKAVSAPL